MSKTKKNRPSDSTIKNLRPSKSHKWDKELTQKQSVLVIAIGTVLILIMLAGLLTLTAYISGRHRLDTQGFKDPDDIVPAYFISVQNRDRDTMTRFFHAYAVDSQKLINEQMTYAEQHKDSLKYDMDSLKFESKDNADLTQIETTTGIPGISAVKIYSAIIKSTQVIDEITYELNDPYSFVTYQINSRWYICSIKENQPEILSAKDADQNDIDINKSLSETIQQQIIGDTVTGVINIDASWTQQDENPDQNVVKSYMYADPNGQAAFAISAIRDINASTMAETLYANLLKSHNETVADDVTTETDTVTPSMEETDLNGNAALLISDYDTSSARYLYVWVFETPLRDGYAHCITFTCAEEYLAYGEFAYTFRFPDTDNKNNE